MGKIDKSVLFNLVVRLLQSAFNESSLRKTITACWHDIVTKELQTRPLSLFGEVDAHSETTWNHTCNAQTQTYKFY